MRAIGDHKSTRLGSSPHSEPVVQLSPARVKAVWQSVKGGFKGKGGKRAFWAVIAILMTQGRVEGDIGRSPKEGDMLQLCEMATGKVMKIMGMGDQVG